MKAKRKEVSLQLSQFSLIPPERLAGSGRPRDAAGGASSLAALRELLLRVCCRARHEQTEQGRQDRPRAKRTCHPSRC